MPIVSTVFKRGLFNNKIAIVTGGGTGIGFVIGKELAYLGCTVIIASRKVDNLKASSNKINDMLKTLHMTNKCIPIQLNIRSSSSIKQFIETLVNQYNISIVDYLVNNAGGQYPSNLEDISEKGWKAVIDLNLNGTFLITNYIFNRFWKKRNKHDQNEKVIVNITASSSRGIPLMAHSSAARAAVENLTMVMAQNWSKYGVRANSVAPGFIDSSGVYTYSKAFREQYFKAAMTKIYLYRMGKCEEVSHAVSFLLSPGASFITGASLRVDGGVSVYNPLLPPTKPSKL
eukprot:25949_1